MRCVWVLPLVCLLGACALTPTAPTPPPQAAVATAAPAAKPKREKRMPRHAKLSVPSVATADVWKRFAQARAWQPCVTDAGIDRWIARYAGSPERFATTLTPLVPLMDYVLTRATELELPGETMLIPIVESYYRPDARGPGGALGLWQLMPDTASRFGLVRRGGQDDRLDVRSSTEAALRLLVLNSEAFSKNPKLMFAAYNAGAYRLRKALGGRAHETLTSLEGLGLSRTTEDYLDKIKALGCLLGEPDRFRLGLPPLPETARLIEFKPPFAIDPVAVSAKIGVPAATLKNWNASAFARGAADSALPLLIPRASEPTLSAALSAGSLSEHTPKTQAITPITAAAAATSVKAPTRTHRVKSGDSLWEISKRYRVRLADLMRWNKLNKKSVLRLGQQLRLDAP
jgi:membrane-bound lytic murein transglycosylase D